MNKAAVRYHIGTMWYHNDRNCYVEVKKNYPEKKKCVVLRVYTPSEIKQLGDEFKREEINCCHF
jgi:hypothetical protein